MKKSSEVFIFGNEVRAVQAAEGISRKVLGYNENMMVCQFRLDKGAVIASHAHPHDQTTTVISGKLSYTVGDETRILQGGDCVIIAGGVPHAIQVLEDTCAIDTFSPMREDFV